MRNRFERKLVSVVIALAMLLSLLPMSAFAAEDGAGEAAVPMAGPTVTIDFSHIGTLQQDQTLPTTPNEYYFTYELSEGYYFPTLKNDEEKSFRQYLANVGNWNGIYQIISSDAPNVMRITLAGKVSTEKTSDNTISTSPNDLPFMTMAEQIITFSAPEEFDVVDAADPDGQPVKAQTPEEERTVIKTIFPASVSPTAVIDASHIGTFTIGQSISREAAGYVEFGIVADTFKDELADASSFMIDGWPGITQEVVRVSNTTVRLLLYGQVRTMPTTTTSPVANGLLMPQGERVGTGSLKNEIAAGNLTSEKAISIPFNSRTITLNVTQAVLVQNGLPSTKAITYGETLSVSTFTGGIPKIGVSSEDAIGKWQWENGSTVPNVANPPAQYTAKFVPTNEFDYSNIISVSVSVTVNPADLTLPTGVTAPVATSVYSGQPLSSSTLTPTSATLSGVSGASIAGTWAWAVPSTTVNAAGSYAVKFTPSDGTDKLNYKPYEASINVALNSGNPPPQSGPSSSSAGASGVASYVVAFETNGGSAIKSVSVAHGLKVTKPADPTKSGAEFLGWYADKELTTVYDFNKPVTANITIYAKWSEDGTAGDESADGVEGPYADWNNPFADVSPSDWFFEDVGYAYETGLMVGTSDTTFEPNTPLTRAMLVTVLNRYDGETAPSAGTTAEFNDIDTAQYYYEPLLWAVENELVLGDGAGNFRPDDPISRQEFAVILMRYSNYTGVNIPAPLSFAMFADGDEVAEYASNAIQMLHAMDIMKGVGGDRIDPNGFATRAQVAALIHRYDTHVIALGMETGE